MTVRPGEQLRQLAAKATPGPWELEEDGAVIDPREGVLVSGPPRLADARLIALAPDLAVLVADLADELAGLEWSSEALSNSEEACPDCGAAQLDGHTNGCGFAALLARVRELEARITAVVGERQPGT